MLYQSTADSGAPIVREGVTRKLDSAPVKVVHLPENSVPKFERMKDFRNWLKSLLMADGNPPVTIQSTGARTVFTGANVRASLKRSRSKEHREAYAALRKMISLAEYDHFEPADTRHPQIQGQDVYYAALNIDRKLYSVRLKLDVPLANNVNGGKTIYKDHKLTEIEIAPALYGIESDVNPSYTQPADAISTVSLGVLRGDVKPSSYDGKHLSQERRGQIQFSPDGTSLVTLFKEADSSTFVHEMGHLLLRDLLADALIAGVKQNGGFYILNAPGMRDGSDWASVVKKREHRRGKLVFPLFYYIMNKVNFLHHKACNISVVDKSSHIRYSTLGGAFLKSEVACLWAALQVTSERRIMPALLARCVLQESRSSPCGTLRAIFRDNLLKFF